MKKNRFIRFLIFVFATISFFLVSSCSQNTSASVSTGDIVVIQPTATKEKSILKTNTPAPTPPPTNTVAPAPQLELQWKIKIGDLKFFAVLSNGTIHGFGPKIHAVITKNGKVLKAEKIDLSDCISDQGLGVGSVSNHYYTRPDDSIILFGSAGYCLVKPKGSLTIQKLGKGLLFPYHDDINQIVVQRASIAKPEGFKSGGLGWQSLADYSVELDQLINDDQTQIALPNHNGAYSVIRLPEDFDITRYSNYERSSTIFLRKVAWDDMFLIYPAYDAIGNKIGDKTLRYKANGEQVNLDPKPALFEDLSFMTSSYKFKEIYNEENKGKSLVRYSEDLTPLARYPLPEDMPTQSNLWGVDPITIGNDHAIYAIVEKLGDEPYLYKWEIIGDPKLAPGK